MNEADYKTEILVLKIALRLCCRDIEADGLGDIIIDHDSFNEDVDFLVEDYIEEARELFKEIKDITVT